MTETAKITFTVEGRPIPQGSKRAIPLKKDGQYTGRVSMLESSDKLSGWRADIREEARRRMNGFPVFDDPCFLVADFYFRRPKGHYGTGKNAGKLKPSAPPYHTNQPDASKLLRAIEDAMEGIVYVNDKLIVEEYGRKHWAHWDGVTVQVTI